MKFKISLLFILISSALYGQKSTLEQSIARAAKQSALMVDKLDATGKTEPPRTIEADGSVRYVSHYDWTSGFFPGSLWYLYELTGDAKWLAPAKRYTEALEHIKSYTGNHDIGFMVYCSFGSGARLMGDSSYDAIIVEAARSLTKRFKPVAGVIQSWDSSSERDFPVIIDNMMNLELLFAATEISGDSTFWDIALSHADATIENHYREDMSTWHVVNYSRSTGVVTSKITNQGYSDDSAWSRGQAWGLYGYTLCYRFTKDRRYLDQAEKIAEFIFSHPNMPKDLVPYWDYDAPKGQEQPRDASAAAIAASAIYELSTYVDGATAKRYKKLADKVVESLSSPAYMAGTGENGGFILMHSVGSKPHGVEVDVPLNYADYYYLEALKRKRDLEKR